MMRTMRSRLLTAVLLVTFVCLALPAEARRRRTPPRAEAATVYVAGEKFPAPTPNAPRVLLIGDSNFFGPLGHTLRKAFAQRAYHVQIRGKPSSGLARPEFFDWFAESERLIAEFHPDLVVVMLGANDVQRITWPALDDRIQWRNETPWRRAYQGRYRAFARFLSERVPEVVLLSPTNRGWDTARDAVTRVREVQQRAVRGLTNVHWIDMFPLSSNPDGSWLRFADAPDGKQTRRIWYRRPDRIHLTKDGGKLVGTRVMDSLTKLDLQRARVHW